MDITSEKGFHDVFPPIFLYILLTTFTVVGTPVIIGCCMGWRKVRRYNRNGPSDEARVALDEEEFTEPYSLDERDDRGDTDVGDEEGIRDQIWTRSDVDNLCQIDRKPIFKLMGYETSV